jgi:polyhydroxybutyrate depolymerase
VRTYELRLPADYDGSEPKPLLLAFHGNPDNAIAFEGRIGLTDPATTRGAIVVYPDGLQGTWGPWDIPFADALIEHLTDGLSIDSDRIYITGYSAGGLVTQDIVCARSQYFAAAAVVAATTDTHISSTCQLPQPLPIVFVHGTEDQAFPWDGLAGESLSRLSVEATFDFWSRLNACSDEPVVNILPDLADDGTQAFTWRRSVCVGQVEVMLYGIEGGGHTWPSAPGPFPPGRISQEISSEEILDFLFRHPAPLE